MTPHDALAVIGVISLISLFVLVTTTAVRALAWLVGDHRARGATHIHWSPGQPATAFPPAADARGVITRRLPRGWAPNGRVIDVSVGAP